MSVIARYRRVYAIEWHDPALRALDADARLVRFYASAGPQATSVGCFRVSSAVAAEDLGGTAEEFEERLQQVCDAFGWAWDPEARVLWITNWFELNPPANPNVVNSWAKLLRNVPDCNIKTQAIASINQSLKELPASFREPWRELLKLFPVSESKAQSWTETPQGSGIREFRSGNREQAAALTRKNKGAGIDARILREASAVIQEEGRNGDDEYLLDVLTHRCRQNLSINVSRVTAKQALFHSRETRTA